MRLLRRISRHLRQLNHARSFLACRQVLFPYLLPVLTPPGSVGEPVLVQQPHELVGIHPDLVHHLPVCELVYGPSGAITMPAIGVTTVIAIPIESPRKRVAGQRGVQPEKLLQAMQLLGLPVSHEVLVLDYFQLICREAIEPVPERVAIIRLSGVAVPPVPIVPETERQGLVHVASQAELCGKHVVFGDRPGDGLPQHAHELDPRHDFRQDLGQLGPHIQNPRGRLVRRHLPAALHELVAFQQMHEVVLLEFGAALDLATDVLAVLRQIARLLLHRRQHLRVHIQMLI
mmetsp:Transcript_1567/g.5175  ORF Transcript_1567/g.5175 Transcript_1567/m.5175 type:complete len:288 (-) Transcript_1567:525-1388(-)